MAVTPSSLSITYRKNSGLVPNQLVEIDNSGAPELDSAEIISGTFQVPKKPTWLKVILQEVVYKENDPTSILKFVVKVAIDPVYAENLANGFHTGNVDFQYKVDFGFGYGTVTQPLTINLTVLEDVKLSIDKTRFDFNYTIGDPAPAGQFLKITTDTDWSITAEQPWVSFSNTNGNGNGVVTINVDVAGKQPGLYTSDFIVDDGDTQKTGTVYLTVEGTGDAEDYLNVSPVTIKLSETYQQPPQRSAQIRVDSSLTGTITTGVNWLSLSSGSIAQGLNEISLNTVNTESLAVGSYFAEVTVQTAYGIRIINILLEIVSLQTSGIQSNGFYYAKDRNTLFLTSGSLDNEAVLDHTTQATLELMNYKKRVPYFKNAVNAIIGLETSLLLRPQPLPVTFVTQYFLPVKPIRIDLKVYDKDMNSASMEERATFGNMKFLNGKSPKTPGLLTYLPAVISVPVDGIVSFSFRSETAVSEVSITGDYTGNIPVVSLAENIYGVILNIADLGLSNKESVDITCGPVTLKVRIKPSEFMTSQIIWLNEWDCPEVFNTTGMIEIISEDDSTTAVTTRSGKEYTSIVETKEPVKFKVATGNIFGEEEVKFLATILRSKKCWLQIGPDRFEVIKTFRSISVSETRRTTHNFNLTFDAAEK